MTELSLNEPIISVIIPAFNSEKTIKETIDSVLKQTFTDFEIIVINDGSQDTTLELIEQIKDDRIKVFSFNNAGGNVSRNRGLKLAVGEFVSFLDADDLWTPDKLESQLADLKNNLSAQVAYSWTDYIDENGKFLVRGTHITANGDVYEQLLVSNFLENGSNPLIRRKALIALGGFDESLNAAQDWDMWLRLADQYHFVAIPSVQILYRVTANSLSTNLTRQEKSCLQVMERAYQRRPVIAYNMSRSLAHLYKYLTCKALQAPFNREKGLVAAKFLWHYCLNESLRFSRVDFIFKLLLKIIVIIILSPKLSNKLLTKTNQEVQIS